MGDIIDIRRPGGSIRLRGHGLEFLVTPDAIGRHMKRENNAEMAEQNMELVEENFRLRNAVKSLKEQLEKAGMGSSCGWCCQICMEEEHLRLVLGCGHSICDQCEEIINKCPFCDTRNYILDL